MVRVAAVDAATGVEVVVAAPANTPQAHLRDIAMRKLRARLAREGG